MDINAQQAAIRDLLRLMMEVSGHDASSLAREAGMAPSTLTRFLNKPVKHLLTARTLAKLSQVTGVPVPVGAPQMTAAERELLAGFRATDQQGREMALRFVRSLRPPSADEPQREAPTKPGGPAPPRPFPGGSVAKNVGNQDCDNIILLPRVPA